MESRFFKEFKKQRSNPYYKKESGSPRFYFAIYQDEKGVFVKSVDKNLKPRRYEPGRFKGSLMETLYLFNKLKDQERLKLSWENPRGHIYLDRYPELLEKLRDVDNIVTSKGELLIFSNEKNRYHLHIQDKTTHYETYVNICNSFIDRVISPNYALVKSIIVETYNVGSSYKNLKDISSTILPYELDLYLSVVLSTYDNIDIKYNGLKVSRGFNIDLTPALYIEGVDSSGYLTISASYSYKDKISPNFYRDYTPSKYAYVDRSLGEIVVSEINSLPDPYERLIRILYFIEEKYELKDSFYIDSDRVIANKELSRYLLGPELKYLLEEFTLFGEKELEARGIKKVTPNMELLLTSAIDYLQGDAYLEFENSRIPLFQAVKELDKKGYIELNGGVKGVLDLSYINRIKKAIDIGSNGVNISIFDIDYIRDELEGRVKGGFSLSQKVDRDIAINQDTLNGTLRDYQAVGVKWLLNLHNLRVSPCLADDMGLGKTIQAISLLQNVEKERDSRPVLIVMPKSLIFNWRNEFNKFAPEYTLYSYYGNSRKIKKIRESDIIFTTFHTLRNDIEELKEVKFFYSILDEIQHIKNYTSKISKAACLLDSEYRLGISGTPVENNLGDLYSISRFLNPTLFGSFRNFKENWSGPMATEDSDIVTNRLKRKISPIFLRRIKEDVLGELPPKSEQVIYLDMSPPQISLYERVRKDYHNKIRLKIREEGLDKSKLTIIKAFMELRQIATNPDYISNEIISSPKRDAVIDHLLDTVSGGHKVLVFSNFLWSLDTLKKELKNEGINYRVITGEVSNREDIVEEFNSDPSIDVLLMTLKTGGVGLNLTSANYVYLMDPWWNLATENQAIDRTHRIGQENPVFCYRFIMRGTIEEKILDLHSKKRDLFDSLFSPVKGDDFNLDEERLEYLLGDG